MLWAACADAQTVEGSVVNSATGNGISNVKVEILKAGNTVFEAFGGDVIYSATTDAQGYFRIKEVREGAYTARYLSTGALMSMNPWLLGVAGSVGVHFK